VFWLDRLDVAMLRSFESAALVGHCQVTDPCGRMRQ